MTTVDKFTPGRKAWWTYAPKSGGVLYVPVTIVKAGPVRVTVDVPLVAGGTRRVRVSRNRISVLGG